MDRYVCENCYRKTESFVFFEDHGRYQNGIRYCNKCKCYGFTNPAKEVEHNKKQIEFYKAKLAKYEEMLEKLKDV